MDQVTSLQILEKMEFFYNNAWNKLMALIGLLGVLVGIGVPVAWYFLQRRFFRIEEEKVKEEFKKTISDNIENEFKKREEKLAKVIDDKTEKMEKRISEAEGGLFHVQGVTLEKAGNSLGAFRSFLQAIPCYLDAKDEGNLQTVLNNLNKNWCEIDNKFILELEAQSIYVDKFIKMLEKNNEDGRHSNYIRRIKIDFEKAKSRKGTEEKPSN